MERSTHEFLATCGTGLAPLLADELRSLDVDHLRPLNTGVSFFGSLEAGYRALLWSRTASRILLILDRVNATTADALYQAVAAMDWTIHIKTGATIAVSAHGTNAELRNTRFVAQRVKDAICDTVRAATGSRPDVDFHKPDILIDVSVHRERATIAIDLSGTSLSRREYRLDMQKSGASLGETLAAALVLAVRWPETFKEYSLCVDPFCGQGVLLIEAAFIAGDIAPGILRSRWGFEGWLGHDAVLWDHLIGEADERAATGRSQIPSFVGFALDDRSMKDALDNVKRAGLSDCISIEQGGAETVSSEASALVSKMVPGTQALLITDLLVGASAVKTNKAVTSYVSLAAFVAAHDAKWTLSLLAPDAQIDAFLKRRPERVIDTFSGPLVASIRVFSAGPAGTSLLESPEAAPASTGLNVSETADSFGSRTFEKGTDQFIARLRKMARIREKWARKQGISCYRVYDADLPDYAVAIDVYNGAGDEANKRWVCIAEYQAPREIDPDKAARRCADVLMTVPEILAVDQKNVFLRVRKHSKGGLQHMEGSVSTRTFFHTVAEGQRRYRVEFGRLLDTGLFLDGRPIRDLLQSMARGKDCLNLFSYTGTASVAMAAGGAQSVLTQDLSQGYLEWAEHNMGLNGFTDARRYRYERGDAMRWVREARAAGTKFGLIYVDPPTFSNSSKMGNRTWDVQRDHVELLIATSRLLAPDGIAYFCCNLRAFKPDLEALEKARVKITDITSQTIGEDFARRGNIHHCYEFSYEPNN